MAATAARTRPITELRDRVVRHAELVGIWAVDCIRAHRPDTDWAADLLGDPEHRHERASLDHEGYHVDALGVQRIASQRGTAYVRLTCSVSVRPARLQPALSARSLHGILDELLLAPARARATAGRLIDAAIVPGR